MLFRSRPVPDPEFYTVLGNALVKKTTEILATQSSTKTIGLKKLSSALLPGGDTNRKNIAQLVTLAERIEHLEAVENAVDLVGLRSEVRMGPEREILEERISRLLTRLAKKSFDAKQGDQAIKLLAQVEPQWREDESLKLGSKALVLYRESFSRNAAEWIFDVEENRKFLEIILEKDPGSKSTVAELFSI